MVARAQTGSLWRAARGNITIAWQGKPALLGHCMTDVRAVYGSTYAATIRYVQVRKGDYF
jgi:hypothetical protein